MTKTNKMTLKDYFAELRVLAEANGRTDLVEFVDGRIEQIEKKNKSASGDRKPTEKQIENEAIKSEILKYLPTENDLTVGEMIKEIPACDGLSSSKVTALIHQLVKSGAVIRTEVKGRAYFRKA